MIALRERAGRNCRSVQSEVRHILAAAAAEPVGGQPVKELRLVTTNTSEHTSEHKAADSTWRREEIYDDDGR